MAYIINNNIKFLTLLRSNVCLPNSESIDKIGSSNLVNFPNYLVLSLQAENWRVVDRLPESPGPYLNYEYLTTYTLLNFTFETLTVNCSFKTFYGFLESHSQRKINKKKYGKHFF